MAEYNYNKSFKTKKDISPRTIMSFVACALGLISFCFLAGAGIKFVYKAGGSVDVAMGNLIWGGGTSRAVAYANAGLICGFFFTIAALLIVLGVAGFHYIGFVSFLLFLTSAVLTFCSVPLCQATIEKIGYGSAFLGWGAYAYGGLNLIGAVVSFLAARGD